MSSTLRATRLARVPLRNTSTITTSICVPGCSSIITRTSASPNVRCKPHTIQAFNSIRANPRTITTLATAPDALNGGCACGSISWSVPKSSVKFTATCHCTECQKTSGSAWGSTSLMVYDYKGVSFSGDTPNRYKETSEGGNSTQRGFCSKCGSNLFNHVSEGNPDEHYALRMGGMTGKTPKPKPEKEIFMKSKTDWMPKLGVKEHDMMPH